METSSQAPWYQTVPIPALLRHARSAYGNAMRAALDANGYDDMPPNGMYVIGGLALGAGDVPLSQLIKELGVSKQAAGQLVDALVIRGYLTRSTPTDDRRRLNITLTPRGHAAAATQRAAREQIDRNLAARVGPDAIAQMRRALAALCDMGRQDREDDHDAR